MIEKMPKSNGRNVCHGYEFELIFFSIKVNRKNGHIGNAT